MRNTILGVFFLAAGCVGQIDGNPNPGDDDDQPPQVAAKEQFVQNVSPIVARCGGTACHDAATTGGPLGHFVMTDANGEYDAITAAPSIVGTFESIAPIITKVDAGHNGIVYSNADRTAIQNWLAAETAERANNPNQPPPPPDPVELLKAFSACMTLDNFTAANMPTLFGGMAASNGQACRNCHGDGGFGFTDNDQEQPYFDIISTSMSQHLKYFSVSQGKVIINNGSFANAATNVPMHPPFDAMNMSGMPALLDFYTRTNDAATLAGTAGCGPAKLVNP
jgi:hypothetical protein